MNNVCNVGNVAPCHLPDIDPMIDHTLARPDKNLACEVCTFMDEEDKMLLNDRCGTGWHTMCFNPPLSSVPEGNGFVLDASMMVSREVIYDLHALNSILGLAHY